MPDHQEFTSKQLERVENAVNSILIYSYGLHTPGTIVRDILHNQDLMIARPASIPFNNKSSPIGFVQLPAEIRNKIYRYWLVVGEVYPRPKPEEDERLNHRANFQMPQTQIFRLCRQVYAEAAPIHFAENKFVLSYGQLPWIDLTLARPVLGIREVYKMAYFNLKSLSITFDLRDGQSLLSVLQTSSNDADYEDYLLNRWLALESLLRILDLQLLEVSLKNCYCAFCHRRMVEAAAGCLARSLGTFLVRVIVRGLISSDEVASVRETVDLEASCSSSDDDEYDWHPKYEDEDPNEKLTVAFQVTEY